MFGRDNEEESTDQVQPGCLNRGEPLSEALFQKFSALVYEKTGIYLKPEKRELLNARLGKRLRTTGIKSFKEYYEYVMHDRSGDELVQLIDVVSTNFTSFFREQAHFDFLIQKILPELVSEEKTRGRELVFWSSASSSGEEPYTMAMVLEEFAQSQPGFRYRIMATDISTRVLEQAKLGVYTDDKICKVPTIYLKKYFQRGVGRSAGYVKIKANIRNKVAFNHFNLMGKFPWNENLDIIFCRNVMIYFNRETQQELARKFYNALIPGGYLFIGHSESISSLSHEFVQLDATVYKKNK